MNAKSTKHNLKSHTDWAKLNQEDDSDINYSDSPETDAEFWKDAKILMPTHKLPLSLRLDEDIVKYFKKQGRGYQSKINAVLKAYVKVHTHEKRETR